jgi:hypothetical protein
MANHQVTLTWVDSADAGASYNVKRSQTAGSFTGSPINASPLAPGTTTYQDNTVVPGVWFYGIEAIQNGVSSADAVPAASVSIAPFPPTNVVVSNFN